MLLTYRAPGVSVGNLGTWNSIIDAPNTRTSPNELTDRSSVDERTATPGLAGVQTSIVVRRGKEVVFESHFDFRPNTPLNSGDNHRPGSHTLARRSPA
jgi:hypothetical protein